jgi:NAD(P)-dependent dehydrogenase (short-subunit alcohol dehydrogenase family)
MYSNESQQRMKNRYVAVTGAAGTLGKATSAVLTKIGYSVIGIDVTDEIPNGDAFVLTLPRIDLTSPDKSVEAFQRIDELFGSLRALVNLAGGFSWETIESGSLDTWEHLFRMNVVTALNASKAALPLLLIAGGAIVNVSAAASNKADTGMGAYAASKSGVSRLTESLAAELKDRGVRVNAVLPSILDTAANRSDIPKADFDRWVTPLALAEIIGFLISDQARAITGALIPVTART